MTTAIALRTKQSTKLPTKTEKQAKRTGLTKAEMLIGDTRIDGKKAASGTPPMLARIRAKRARRSS
jgi:hypothetical protein